MFQDQAVFSAPRQEILDVRGEINENEFSPACRAIPNPEPDDFGRAAEKPADFGEIRIFCDNGEIIGRCVVPNLIVRFRKQAAIFYVARAGEKIGDGRNQPGRQVLV